MRWGLFGIAAVVASRTILRDKATAAHVPLPRWRAGRVMGDFSGKVDPAWDPCGYRTLPRDE